MENRHFIFILFFIFIFVIITACGSTYWGIIPSGVYIEEVNIGGLTVEKADLKLRDHYNRIYFEERLFACSFKPEDLGIFINFKKTLEPFNHKFTWKKLLMNFREKRLRLNRTIDYKIMENAVLKLSDAVYRAPSEPVLTYKDGDFEVLSGVKGSSLLKASLKSMLTAGVLKNKYRLPLKVKYPHYTTEQLNELKPIFLIAQFTTEFVKNEDRTNNIKVACAKLKNLMLAPGTVFSFNNIIGPREKENGYLSAMIISGGEFVPGLGGGICQVSSTLYNAVLLAGLEVIERYPHTLKINYVSPGRDATVNYGIKDFKFKNNTLGYIMLDYKIQGQELTFYIYGVKKWSEKVKVKDIKYHIVKRIKSSSKYICNDKLLTGTTKVRYYGTPGLIVNSFRIMDIDGEEIKEFLSKDYYRPTARIIEVAPDNEFLYNKEKIEN